VDDVLLDQPLHCDIEFVYEISLKRIVVRSEVCGLGDLAQFPSYSADLIAVAEEIRIIKRSCEAGWNGASVIEAIAVTPDPKNRIISLRLQQLELIMATSDQVRNII